MLAVETMTGRERILATLRGDEVDRFPVWLKMANRTWRSCQPEPYRSMSDVDLLEATGCDLLLGCGVRPRIERPHVTRTTERNGFKRTTVMETPDGCLTEVTSIDPVTGSTHPSRYPVNTAGELRMFRWVYEDIGFHIDEKDTAESRARQKELDAAGAVTMTGIHPSPVMHLVEHVCGLETAIYLMADEPELFREVVDLMHRAQLREMRALLPHVVADTFWLTENTSTTLISPGMFREFCLGHLTEYGNLILEHGIIPVHHMCGTLNALLEMIDGLPAVANEAFTTRPLGDVSLAEGRSRMPSKTLIGGTNATLWLEPVEAIVETVRRDLDACWDRRKIFLTSAGVLPPPVSFEKARAVVEEFKRL
jgi:uroporphyrinogen-III decarboxylase